MADEGSKDGVCALMSSARDAARAAAAAAAGPAGRWRRRRAGAVARRTN
jgi:hypothetical protein